MGSGKPLSFKQDNISYKSSINWLIINTCKGEETNTYDVLDGGWYHVTLPDNGKSNNVILTVDPHDDTKPRQAVIVMQAGNASAYIQ